MKLQQYAINSFWGPRRETPEALAVRFERLIDRLGAIDPIFGNWFWLGRGGQIEPFETIRNNLAENVAERVVRDDFDEPDPYFGYRCSVLNSLEHSPRFISVSARGGSPVKAVCYSNTCLLETDSRVEPDPAIITYAIFRAALLAIAECFDATHSFAYPISMMDLWTPGQKYESGWMTYTCPPFAPLIMPPKTAIFEHRPNGALFTAATDETFVTENPKHLAIARDIEAALAPLNALPWPLDEELE